MLFALLIIRAWDLPIEYLTGQMRCSHLAVFYKFSAKDITLYGRSFFCQPKNGLNFAASFMPKMTERGFLDLKMAEPAAMTFAPALVQ